MPLVPKWTLEQHCWGVTCRYSLVGSLSPWRIFSNIQTSATTLLITRSWVTGFSVHVSKSPSFPQPQEYSLNSSTGPLSHSSLSSFCSCQCLAAILRSKTRASGALVCLLSEKLLQIIAVVLVLGCSSIYKATTSKGNLIISQVCLKAQLMGNPAAAMTFDQRKALVVIITNCCYLSFLQ